MSQDLFVSGTKTRQECGTEVFDSAVTKVIKRTIKHEIQILLMFPVNFDLFSLHLSKSRLYRHSAAPN